MLGTWQVPSIIIVVVVVKIIIICVGNSYGVESDPNPDLTLNYMFLTIRP